MSLGTNIQYLRKINRLTQEQFAEKMNISRQTVSRWEADEVTPELDKLVELCSMFSCKLDELVRENMSFKEEIYSKVEIRKVPSFKMARYVICPRCELNFIDADEQEYCEVCLKELSGERTFAEGLEAEENIKNKKAAKKKRKKKSLVEFFVKDEKKKDEGAAQA